MSAADRMIAVGELKRLADRPGPVIGGARVTAKKVSALANPGHKCHSSVLNIVSDNIFFVWLYLGWQPDWSWFCEDSPGAFLTLLDSVLTSPSPCAQAQGFLEGLPPASLPDTSLFTVSDSTPAMISFAILSSDVYILFPAISSKISRLKIKASFSLAREIETRSSRLLPMIPFFPILFPGPLTMVTMQTAFSMPCIMREVITLIALATQSFCG